MPGSGKINTQCLYFTERFNQTASELLKYPLTVVEAPMGYGKTTAVREQLSRLDIDALWLRVYSDDAAEIWNRFAALIGELDGDCGESLFTVGFPGDAVSMNEALKILSNLSLDNPAAIAIDDYHNLDSQELNAFFEFLAEEAVANLHIILNVRYAKLKRLEELRLKKCLLHITKDALELDPKAISDYFRLCGIPLHANQTYWLYEMTEGWISALYLYLLEYTAVGSFNNSESIFRLLEKTVYAPLDEKSKDFLQSMCIFNNFTLAQAKFIAGEAFAEKTLGILCENNAFISRERSTETYYLHSIFTDFLRDEFSRKPDAIKKELFGRAAEWFHQTGNYHEARKHYFFSGDFDGLLKALEDDDAIDYSPHDKDILTSYMTACPDGVKARHPYALLKYAVPLFVHNDMAQAGQIYATLAATLRTDPSLAETERNQLLGILELHLCFASFNDIDQMTLHQKNAWELLKQPYEIFSRKIHWTFGSPSVLYLYYRESGRLKAHTDALIENLPLYNRLMNGHGAGGGYVMEAERHFNAGAFDDAEISLQKAELAARAAEESNILLCCNFLRIRLDFIKGDGTSLFERLKNLRETMTDRRLYNYLHTVELCEGLVHAWLKLPEKLPRQLMEEEPVMLHIGFPALGMFHILLGRSMLIQGEYFKLLGSGEYFMKIASVFPNLMGIIYTNILLAAANHMVSRREAALECLSKALEMALPDELYLPFVENCDYIELLLQELSGRSSYRAGITRILEIHQRFRAGKERILTTMNTAANQILTVREREIANLAAQGMTNKEIGEFLYISENTVKSALKSVFGKLMVNDRRSMKEALAGIEN